jgi:hypothetical protein
LTVPAAETKSIWLPADSASWRMVPCFLLVIWTILSWLETHNPYPDLIPFNSFIVTSGFSSTYRDFAKTHVNHDPPGSGTAPN